MKVCAEADRRKLDAKASLVHYLGLAMIPSDLSADQMREIEEIVDLIFDAAVIQAREERMDATGA